MKKLSALILLLTIQLSAFAQAGALDLTFGDSGISTIHPYLGIDQVKDIETTTDGKILVLSVYNTESHLLRFKADGTLDSLFVLNGNLVIPVWVAQAIAVDSSNRIVALSVDDDYYDPESYLRRFDEDGSIDSTFGINGLAQVQNLISAKRALMIQADGKIVIGGEGGNEKAKIVRYNDDGSKDASFSSNGGVALTDLDESFIYAVEEQDNGKLLVTGSTDGNMFIGRLNQNGELDTDFGDDGYKIIDNGKLEAGEVVRVTVDGKLIVSGHSEDSESDDMICWRFQDDGTIDDSFGVNGVAIIFSGTGNNLGKVLFTNSDTTIIVGGSEFDGVAYKNILYQLQSDGSLNGNYGDNGNTKTLYINGSSNKLSAVQMEDGKILLAGSALINQDVLSAVTQFLPNGSIDVSFGVEGTSTAMAIDPSTQYNFSDVNDFVILPSQKILCIGNVVSSDGPVLFRLNADGSIDSSYYQTGWFLPYPYGYFERLNAASNSDHIYVADQTGYNLSDEEDLFWNSDAILIRLQFDGTLDSSYGNMGIIHLIQNDFNQIDGIALQPDGKLLIAESFSDISGRRTQLLRLNDDGTLDETFADNGTKIFDWIGVDNNPTVAVRNDGKIMFQTITSSYPTHFLNSAFLNLDGSYDLSYGDNGLMSYPLDFSGQSTILFQEDHKIISLVVGNYNNYTNLLIRMNENGTIDSSFGENGVLLLESTDYAAASAQIDDGGKLLTTGSVYPGELMIHCYLSDGQVDEAFGTNGSNLIPDTYPLSIPGYNEEYKIHLQNDGKILTAGAGFPDMIVCRLLNDVATSSASVKSLSQAEVYPNPASDQLIIHYPFSSNEEATITITDVTGKILREEKVNASADNYVMKLGNLPSGIYLITLQSESNSASTKFVKQ